MSGEANEPMARETFPKKRARSIMDRTGTRHIDSTCVRYKAMRSTVAVSARNRSTSMLGCAVRGARHKGGSGLSGTLLPSQRSAS